MAMIARVSGTAKTLRSMQTEYSSSLLRNSVAIMGTTVVTSSLGFAYWLAAARLYAAREVGLAAAMIAALTLAANLAALGLGSTMIQVLPGRTTAQARSRTLAAALLVACATGTFGGLAVTLAVPILAPHTLALPSALPWRIALASGVPLWAAGTLLDHVFIAERHTGHMFVRNTVLALLKIPLLWLPLLVGSGTASLLRGNGIVASWLLAVALSFLAGLVLLRRLRSGYRPVLHDVLTEIRSLRQAMAGHHLINLGGMAPMYLLPVLVTIRLSAADNAYFYISWMMGSLFFMVSPAVATALFAEGSYAPRSLRSRTHRAYTIIAALLGPAMLVLLLGGHAILAVFGRAYPQHGEALLAILAASAVPDAVTNVRISIWRVQKRLRAAAALNLGMAAATLALAWVFLPSLGIAGAGMAWLMAQLAGCLWVFLASRYQEGRCAS